jgi:hypothetical protein
MLQQTVWDRHLGLRHRASTIAYVLRVDQQGLAEAKGMPVYHGETAKRLSWTQRGEAVLRRSVEGRRNVPEEPRWKSIPHDTEKRKTEKRKRAVQREALVAVAGKRHEAGAEARQRR